jgi:hypothetical protein
MCNQTFVPASPLFDEICNVLDKKRGMAQNRNKINHKHILRLASLIIKVSDDIMEAHHLANIMPINMYTWWGDARLNCVTKEWELTNQ